VQTGNVSAFTLGFSCGELIERDTTHANVKPKSPGGPMHTQNSLWLTGWGGGGGRGFERGGGPNPRGGRGPLPL